MGTENECPSWEPIHQGRWTSGQMDIQTEGQELSASKGLLHLWTQSHGLPGVGLFVLFGLYFLRQGVIM